MARGVGQRYYYFARYYDPSAVLEAASAATKRADSGLDLFLWSGIGDATELAAARSTGTGVGVTALTRSTAVPLGPTLRQAISQIPRNTALFVDSGAYSAEGAGVNLDRHFVGGRPAWDFIFDSYRELAKGRRRDNTFVVAPDKIGDQATTLRRLARHAPALRALSRRATVLVALQPGEEPPWRFAREVDGLIGEGWVPALPLAGRGWRRALRPAWLERFVALRRPARIHLLGAGPPSQTQGRAGTVIPILRSVARKHHLALKVQSDSALSRGMTTATRQFREGIRRALPLDALEPYAVGGDAWKLPNGVEYDLTDDWTYPFALLDTRERRRVADDLRVDPQEPGPSGLTPQEKRTFVADPEGFLMNPPRTLLDDPSFWFSEVYPRFHKFVYREFLDTAGATELRKHALRGAAMERIYGAPPSRSKPIALISCGACKDAPGRSPSWKGPARDLYTGSLFRDQRTHVESKGLPYFILSAKHGLLQPLQKVGLYEQRMSSRKADRDSWSNRVLSQLERSLGSVRGRTFEIHAGRDYRDPLVQLLRRRGASVTTPTEGKNIFELRSYYKSHR